ncbi:MAG: PQQ-binding-like beta-propeller repeat protein [Myxococcota bacterium]|nr:PQQ-binding-like beta-propeller repeat protein [Myxococcota bacterium]
MMPGQKIGRVMRLIGVGLLVIFSFGAAGEICGRFFETTPAAFGSKFRDNNPEDIRSVLSRVRGARPRAGQPENTEQTPIAVMVVEAAPRALVGWDLKKRREIWKISSPISSEVTLGGDLVIFQSGNAVAAHDIASGELVFTYPIEEGWDYHGADVGNAHVAISVGVGGRDIGTYANGRLILLSAKTGSVLWELGSGGGLLGSPVIRGDVVFVPWDRQKIVAIDASNGEEICRLRAVDFTINHLEANSYGVFYGSLATEKTVSALYRLDENAATGTREGSTMMVPGLDPVPGDPGFSRDTFAKAEAGRSADEKIRFHWQAARSAPGSIAMANGQFYLHYWRYIIAFDAATNQVLWTYRSTEDIESMKALDGGVIGVDSNGRVFFLFAKNGAPAWHQETGQKVLTAVFDTGTFKPSNRPTKKPDPLVGLKEMIWDKDNRMLPIRAYVAFLIAAIDRPEVTRDLLQIYGDASMPRGLRDAAVRALERRKKGAKYLIDSLKTRYDYLENTTAPPMNVVAPALVNMKERSAVPGLLAHLMDHETPPKNLVHIAAAIHYLGDPSVVGVLKQFVTRYHADSSLMDHEDALAIASEAILKFDNRQMAEQFIQEIREDSQTLPELKTQLARIIDPIAAAKAEAVAREKAAAVAKAQKEALAKAEAEKTKQPPRALTKDQINQVLADQQQALRPCVQAALVKVPTLQSIRMRFLLTGSTGRASDLRILPNNISGLRECLGNAISGMAFPTFKNLRQMATYSISINTGKSYQESDQASSNGTHPDDR